MLVVFGNKGEYQIAFAAKLSIDCRLGLDKECQSTPIGDVTFDSESIARTQLTFESCAINAAIEGCATFL